MSDPKQQLALPATFWTFYAPTSNSVLNFAMPTLRSFDLNNDLSNFPTAQPYLYSKALQRVQTAWLTSRETKTLLSPRAVHCVNFISIKQLPFDLNPRTENPYWHRKLMYLKSNAIKNLMNFDSAPLCIALLILSQGKLSASWFPNFEESWLLYWTDNESPQQILTRRLLPNRISLTLRKSTSRNTKNKHIKSVTSTNAIQLSSTSILPTPKTVIWMKEKSH